MNDIVIAQLTDLHIAPESDPVFHTNVARLDACLSRISQMRRQPDLLLLTGDLTEHGDNESLELLLDRVRRTGFAFRIALGNHDVIQTSSKTTRRKYSLHQDWTSSIIGRQKLRVVTIDSCKSGRHGGQLSEKDASIIDDLLGAEPQTDTLLAIHHPPCKVGIDWMDPANDMEWTRHLERIVQLHPQIIGIVSGHIHASAHTTFANVRLCVTPAVAARSHVELAPIDANIPDGRALIEESPPGFALHRYFAGGWTSFMVYADNSQPLVSFEGRYQSLVRHTQELDG